MKRRAQQISSNLQRELQTRISRGFNDPRIRGLITVTKVELTDDLKHAKAFITVLPEERADLTMHGLKAALGRIRKDVMERIHIKEVPTLKLVYDHGLKEQQKISELLASDPFRKDESTPEPESVTEQQSQDTAKQDTAESEEGTS